MSELIDNRAERVRTLKRVIYGLHHGEDPAAVKARLTALIGRQDRRRGRGTEHRQRS